MRKDLLALTIFLFSWSVAFAQHDEGHRFAFDIGGGVGNPVGTTSDVAGTSGNFVAGGGVNFRPALAFIGEFMWHGLPPSRSSLDQITAGITDAHANLYSVTGNVVYKFRPQGRIGAYGVFGGGWYHRSWSITVPTVVPGTVCGPVFGWYGVTCVNGLVPADAVIRDGSSDGGGFNVGAGFTFGHEGPGAKFYTEVRYHHAYMDRFDTEVLPLTFGIRW